MPPEFLLSTSQIPVPLSFSLYFIPLLPPCLLLPSAVPSHKHCELFPPPAALHMPDMCFQVVVSTNPSLSSTNIPRTPRTPRVAQWQRVLLNFRELDSSTWAGPTFARNSKDLLVSLWNETGVFSSTFRIPIIQWTGHESWRVQIVSLRTPHLTSAHLTSLHRQSAHLVLVCTAQ